MIPDNHGLCHAGNRPVLLFLGAYHKEELRKKLRFGFLWKPRYASAASVAALRKIMPQEVCPQCNAYHSGQWILNFSFPLPSDQPADLTKWGQEFLRKAGTCGADRLFMYAKPTTVFSAFCSKNYGILTISGAGGNIDWIYSLAQAVEDAYSGMHTEQPSDQSPAGARICSKCGKAIADGEQGVFFFDGRNLPRSYSQQKLCKKCFDSELKGG